MIKLLMNKLKIIETQRTHGQNQGGGWKQGREVGLAGVG